MNSAPTNTVQTRTIEQSLSAAFTSMNRAEQLLTQLHYSVTGYSAEGTASEADGAFGIMHDADRLAGRLESFCSDLERTSARITAPNVKSLGSAGLGSAGYASDARNNAG